MSADYRPFRIACLQPSATVILDYLGQLERVIACTKYCADLVPTVREGKRRIVADSWSAQAEEILEARPDLVIAAVPYQQEAVSEILKAGIRFVGLAPRTLSDIYADITLIAGMVGEPARGMEVISDMNAKIEVIRRRSSALPRKRVFCEEWGKPVIASQPWVAELVEAAGGEFIGTPGSKISSHDLGQRDPEVFIASWCGAGDRVPLERLIRERGWQYMTATRNGQVYCISDELLNTPAPTLVKGLSALAAAIHPAEFPRVHGLRPMTTEVPSSIDFSVPRVV